MLNDVCSRAIAYYRLSEKDKMKTVSSNTVSNSIENQRKLIRSYLEKHDDIVLINEYFDDGYTGTNYDRPGFCAVLNEVKSGNVDCIIVKDLSRMGREYIETGKFLEEIFPQMGVRFISVNDDYDSSTPKQSDDILIPIKNLMNETYCRELSAKLRKQFMVQRRNGEYLGAFASYGYCKSPEDKHKLILDEYAAEIVQSIFYYKIQGYSQQAIANTLNSEGVLAPSEYKKQQGLRYKSGFRTSAKAEWSAVTITHILKNRLYIGELIQGKRGTPNFKIKKVRERKEEEWTVVKNNHEAIVDPMMFEVVQKMLKRDTRTSPDREAVLPLAGMVYCADCGRSALIRSVTRAKKKFFYYVCSSYKRGEGCTSHSIAQSKLEHTVLNAMKAQIQTVAEIDLLLASISQSEIETVKQKKLSRQIAEKEKEIESYRAFRDRLYETLNENLIDKDEFIRMRDKYRALESECQNTLDTLCQKRDENVDSMNDDHSWIEQYLKYRDIPILTREAVVTLVDKIVIYEDKRVEITFNYRDEIAYYLDIAQNLLKEVG